MCESSIVPTLLVEASVLGLVLLLLGVMLIWVLWLVSCFGVGMKEGACGFSGVALS